MKITAEKIEFRPIDLNIRVETKRELEILWACFNVSTGNLNRNIEDSGIQEFAQGEPGDIIGEIWNTLDRLRQV